MRPSRRREMAQKAVQDKGIPIRLACAIFSVRETCYRYEAKSNAENEQIANWLIRLTDNNRSWGFVDCVICTYATSRTSYGTTNASTVFTGS